MLGLEAGHLLLVRHKGIFAMRDHEPVEVPRDWLCLNVEVPEHLVAVPAANQLDGVAVDTRTEEGHVTIGAKGLGRHILGFEY